MQEAGTVLHLARSGRLIIKASAQVADGTLLVDDQGRRIGRVMEMIGPVDSPFISVQPMTDRIERVMGAKLFVSDTHPLSERPKNRGKERGRRPYGGPVIRHQHRHGSDPQGPRK